VIFTKEEEERMKGDRKMTKNDQKHGRGRHNERGRNNKLRKKREKF